MSGAHGVGTGAAAQRAGACTCAYGAGSVMQCFHGFRGGVVDGSNGRSIGPHRVGGG